MRVVMVTLLMLAALLSVTADVTDSVRHRRNDVIDDAGFRVLDSRQIDDDAVPGDYVWLARRSGRLAAARYAAARNQAKRRPMFVGKRLETTNDVDEPIDYNERSGPMFVGKRRNPFFVG